MKIGIIFYSHSGHTLSITEKLREKLTAAGYSVGIEQLETVGPLKLSDQTAELKAIPSVEVYDSLVIASPVHGGRLSSPMAEFLKKAPSLKDKQVVCLAAHFLPYGMGAKQMIQLMKAACQAKGAQIIGAGDVPRLSLRQNKHIEDVVNLLVKPS
jgi:NAD(P)H dehydrogenase (quinone)